MCILLNDSDDRYTLLGISLNHFPFTITVINLLYTPCQRDAAAVLQA